MICAVTGANGFVGSHLVERLVAEGYHVRVLVRQNADLRWIRHLPLKTFYGTLDDYDVLLSTFDNCQRVFHIAGLTTAHNRSDFLWVNAQGTRNVARACLEAAPGIERMVMISSVAAQGPGHGRAPLTEQLTPQPINDYGESKLAGENEAIALSDRLPLTIVRPGGIYGPREKDLRLLLLLAARGVWVKVGLGYRAINLAHIEDIVSGILLAGTRREAIGESFLIGGTENHTLEQACQIMVRTIVGSRGVPLWLPISVAYGFGLASGVMARWFGSRRQLNIDRIRLLAQRNWAIDISKARRLLGYKPRYDLAGGVAQTINWYREQGILP